MEDFNIILSLDGIKKKIFLNAMEDLNGMHHSQLELQTN
jgi:hypothetical protein